MSIDCWSKGPFIRFILSVQSRVMQRAGAGDTGALLPNVLRSYPSVYRPHDTDSRIPQENPVSVGNLQVRYA